MTTALAKPNGWHEIETRLARVLTRGMNREQFLGACLAVSRDRQLAKCNPRSLLGALYHCAILGWIPNSPLQHCAIIPFKRTATLIPMYKGLIDLARRSGNVLGIRCEIVYANDQWYHENGTSPVIKHTPWWDPNVGAEQSGAPVAVWCCMDLVRGGNQIKVMQYSEALARREESASYRAWKRDKNKDSPWVTHEKDMVAKTCVKEDCKLAPQSAEMARAIEIDNAAEMGNQELTMPGDEPEAAKPPEHDDLIDGEQLGGLTGETTWDPEGESQETAPAQEQKC